jgi:hypothetical protein
MPLRRTLPHVAILLVGQAVLAAGPAIVAEREGGMGLGSALIAATVTQLAGIVVGATLAGLVVDRRSAGAALLSGALLYYVGLLATGVAPMGSLATVVAGMGIAGIGFGFLLTAAFADAAALEVPRERAMAVGLLLAAPIAGRLVVGTAFATGPVAFIVAGVTVVGLAILAARLPGAAPRSADPSSTSPAPAARSSTGREVLAAAILGLGALLSVAGVDPSRLSASLLVGMVGGGGLESLDTARAAMATIGVALILAGAAMLLAGADRAVRIAAPGLLLVGFAGSGIAASLTQAMTAGRVPDGSAALIGATGALTGWAGLAVGGALATGPRRRRLPATIGSAALAVACALGWLTLLGPRPEPGAVAPMLLVGVAGLGAGIAVAALRLALTEVHPTRRGLAAGAGVAAATIGSAVGGLLGAGEGATVARGAPPGIALGLVGFVIAAAGATALGTILERWSGRTPR